MAAEPGDDDYVCTLDEASKKKARDELHELNDKDRVLAVQTLRKWVLEQDWLRSPTDFTFLLRFLRFKKYSQLEARKALEKYWTLRTKSPDWYQDIDPADPTLQEVMESGCFIVPRKRDKNGLKVCIEQDSLIDVTKVKKCWGLKGMYKASMLMADYLVLDENVQVNGILFFQDLTGMSMAHMMTLFKADDTNKMMDFFQNCFPARMKGFHMYAEPLFYDAMMAICSPFMSKKTKSRMVMHGKNMANVYKVIDMECLPEEYLPDDYEGTCIGKREDAIRDDDYVCTLDEASKKKARDELHELNDKDRVLAVQTLRKWVLEQDWLRSPTDFTFLLRFLRFRKYSQLEARKALEKYWTLRTKSPDWYQDIDPADPTLQEVMESGCFIVPRKRDKNGLKVCIEQDSLIDVTKVKKRWGLKGMYKASMLMADYLVLDENVQVNGILFFQDLTGMSMAHMMTLFKADDTNKMMDFFQNCFPARMKGFHMYAEPLFYDAMMAICSPFMSKKTKSRMVMHGKNMANVYKVIDMECLPEEYLPDDYEGTCIGKREDAIKEMIADMNKPEMRAYLMRMSSSQYGVDFGETEKEEQVRASAKKTQFCLDVSRIEERTLALGFIVKEDQNRYISIQDANLCSLLLDLYNCLKLVLDIKTKY